MGYFEILKNGGCIKFENIRIWDNGGKVFPNLSGNQILRLDFTIYLPKRRPKVVIAHQIY